MVLCIKYSYLGSAGSAPPWERGRPLVAGMNEELPDCHNKMHLSGDNNSIMFFVYAENL